MTIYDLRERGAVDYYEAKVEEAYNIWLSMLAYDWPENQVLAIENELAERIEMAERVKKLHEHFAAKKQKRNGATKKHRD